MSANISSSDRDQMIAEGWIFSGARILATADGPFLGNPLGYKEADEQALEFVKRMAACGSEMHQRMLAALIAYKLRHPNYV